MAWVATSPVPSRTSFPEIGFHGLKAFADEPGQTPCGFRTAGLKYVFEKECLIPSTVFDVLKKEISDDSAFRYLK